MTAQIRELPAPEDGKRVETGPLQVGDDWPGMFIRGDNAAGMVNMLLYLAEQALNSAPMSMQMFTLLSALSAHCELLSRPDLSGTVAQHVRAFKYRLDMAAQLADVPPVGGLQ